MYGPGEFPFDVKGERAVDVDVVAERRGEMGGVPVVDEVPFCS